jgi:hypothetical protein
MTRATYLGGGVQRAMQMGLPKKAIGNRDERARAAACQSGQMAHSQQEQVPHQRPQGHPSQIQQQHPLSQGGAVHPPYPKQPPPSNVAPSSAKIQTRRSVDGGDEKELFDDGYATMACKIFDCKLRHNGWKHSKGNELANWRFTYGDNGVAAGTRGINYAYDWGELGKMIEKYGLDHAPKIAPEHPGHLYVELPKNMRKTLAQIHDELLEETTIVADKRKAEDLPQ